MKTSLFAFLSWTAASNSAVPGFPPPDASGWRLPPMLGVCAHYSNSTQAPGETAMLAAGGFKVVRTDLIWGAIAQRGSMHWNTTISLVDSFLAHGVTPMLIWNGGNAQWDNELSPYDAVGRAAFVNFSLASIAAFREHMGGRTGFLFEVYNEPNLNALHNCTDLDINRQGGGAYAEDSRVSPRPLAAWAPCRNVSAYVALAMEVSAAVKAAFPDELLVGPAAAQAPGGIDLDVDFFTPLFEAGALRYLDGVTQHFYRPFYPEQGEAEMLQLQALVALHSPPGKFVPVLSGEQGYSSVAGIPFGVGPPVANASLQGKFLARQFLFDTGMGLNLTVWYDWRDDGLDDREIEFRFGTVNASRANGTAGPYPFAPKPAYFAAQALANFTAACPQYAGWLRFNVSQPLPLPAVACWASYWGGCGDQAAQQGIAVWCAAPEGWSTELIVPAAYSYSQVVAVTAAAGRRFDARNWLGEVQASAIVATFGDGTTPPAALNVSASGSPVYLLPLL